MKIADEKRGLSVVIRGRSGRPRGTLLIVHHDSGCAGARPRHLARCQPDLRRCLARRIFVIETVRFSRRSLRAYSRADPWPGQNRILWWWGGGVALLRPLYTTPNDSTP